jgi:Protein of unknown function (DUF2855)
MTLCCEIASPKSPKIDPPAYPVHALPVGQLFKLTMPTHAHHRSIEFNKSNPSDMRAVSAPLDDTPEVGEVLLRIDRFAFTANNVTYAMFGESMHYWQFFPASDPGWGVIPVWGFATVMASAVEGIAAGERFYGYLPTATHLIVQPERVNSGGFVDGADHRGTLPAVYNQYLRCSTDPGYHPNREAEQMILRPLFFTSFLIDDFLEDNAFFGAGRVILSSASSKTAYGTAFCLSQRKEVEVVGLTSAKNLDFVRSLGCYHQVLTYDQIDALSPLTPGVYVDFSGNVELRRALHVQMADGLKYSASIGGTDWQHLGKVGDLPGPRPTLFFAPSQIKKRSSEWGNAVLMGKLAAAWQRFMVPVTGADMPWLRIVNADGVGASLAAMSEVFGGRAKPDEGHVLSLS